MRVFSVLALCLAAVSAAPPQRIFGGSITTIENYPAIAVILVTFDSVNFEQACGGSILNQRAILTAAHCFLPVIAERFRIRVGSSLASSEGIVHNVNRIIIHPEYQAGSDTDIAIMHAASTIVYNNRVQPASIAGPNYNLGDNQEVWAAGWGAISQTQGMSEELRHVRMYTVNQAVCRERYGSGLTDAFICAGLLDVGGVSPCYGDSGGPLYHRGIVVGVTHGGRQCGSARFPGLSIRVSHFTSWIQANA